MRVEGLNHADLDRYLTGNYGEDQVQDEEPPSDEYEQRGETMNGRYLRPDPLQTPEEAARERWPYATPDEIKAIVAEFEDFRLEMAMDTQEPPEPELLDETGRFLDSREENNT